MNERQPIDEFTAEDGQGNAYLIIEYVENVPTGTLGDAGATIECEYIYDAITRGQLAAIKSGRTVVDFRLGHRRSARGHRAHVIRQHAGFRVHREGHRINWLLCHLAHS